MRAKVFMAWVNMIPKWRVYYDQELIATYDGVSGQTMPSPPTDAASDPNTNVGNQAMIV